MASKKAKQNLHDCIYLRMFECTVLCRPQQQEELCYVRYEGQSASATPPDFCRGVQDMESHYHRV